MKILDTIDANIEAETLSGPSARIHPLWLTYGDTRLEDAFRDSWRVVARPTAKVWAFCGLSYYLLLTGVLYLSDPEYLLSDQWFRLLLTQRRIDSRLKDGPLGKKVEYDTCAPPCQFKYTGLGVSFPVTQT